MIPAGDGQFLARGRQGATGRTRAKDPSRARELVRQERNVKPYVVADQDRAVNVFGQGRGHLAESGRSHHHVGRDAVNVLCADVPFRVE